MDWFAWFSLLYSVCVRLCVWFFFTLVWAGAFCTICFRAIYCSKFIHYFVSLNSSQLAGLWRYSDIYIYSVVDMAMVLVFSLGFKLWIMTILLFVCMYPSANKSASHRKTFQNSQFKLANLRRYDYLHLRYLFISIFIYFYGLSSAILVLCFYHFIIVCCCFENKKKTYFCCTHS